MEPLLLFPDPVPPALAQALDLAGYPWKAVADELSAARHEPDDGWAGAIVCADVDPEGAFALCRALRKRDLPLEPLRLALGPATWDDGREAVIGIPPGGTGVQVWVDRSGRQTLRFSWTLSGVAELGEQRFDLRVPPAATAALFATIPIPTPRARCCAA